ncbi:uncharacterized protein LOC129306629 [Prosopis cineraria]|uniref:uncharacterized protein LOC129306629 n=1 Tax=Prosopis cineraria TaxID=364024 RepID=UPI0024100A77|nr:uncharacterized protein LOC129306629 [Prosopis cineraria]
MISVGNNTLVSGGICQISGKTMECLKPFTDFVDEDGHWKWNLIQNLLPRDIFDNIANISLKIDTEASCTWNLNTNGNFTVKSKVRLGMKMIFVQKYGSFLWLNRSRPLSGL